MNINDSAFVRNGAFASNVPYFADKFKKFQNYNTSPNSFTYHCTWLYQENDSSKPVWLDRYYYPDYISRKSLNKKEGSPFSLSFENILDLNYLNEESIENENLSQYESEQLSKFKNAIKEYGYIDKVSDLTIEGGTTYKYSRISKEMVDEVFEGLSENRIDVVKDQRTNDINLKELFALNNENWRKISGEDFKKTQAINFNTNLYLNPAKKLGIQLFGCDYKYGVNIQNRKDLTPFVYYATSDVVYMLNNHFEVRNQLNIKEKYNVEIKYLVISAPFDDLYLFTSDALFILDYDLRLKSEIQLDTILKNGNLSTIDKSKLYETQILLNNKNLYCVIDGSNIIKIIFNSESDNDSIALKDFYVSSRILNYGEYSTNFTGLQNNSLLQTAHTIKSIIIADGRLYAFNYDILKMSHDGDTIYGIIKEKNNISDGWYYIFNQSIGKIYTDAEVSKYAEFSSDVSIDSIAYGANGYFGLIRGFGSNDTKALEVYDRSKTKIYNYPLANYDKLISFDFYRYIDDSFEEHDVFVALVTMSDYLYAIEYQLDNERIITRDTNINGATIATFRHIIDSNAFMDKLEENKLYFNLFLEENKPAITYEWDMKEITEGWYNINLEVDSDNAIFKVKINDTTVAAFSSENTENFIKHKYPEPLIFDSSYYFGVLGKKYGTTLNEILYDDFAFDPYAVKNTKAENTTLYNRALSYYEYQATKLNFSKINPLVLTLPCGVRNGIEEIERYFKFAKPGSVSNKVKINISGLDNLLQDNSIEVLKSTIIDSLSKGDYLTNIKEIEFI